MAVTVDSEMASNAGDGIAGSPSQPPSPRTFSFTNTAGTILYAGIGLGVQTGGSSSFGAVSYGGNAMTQVATSAPSDAGGRVAIYRLLNPPTGANTFSYAFTESGSPGSRYEVWAGLISLSGNDTTTPEAQTNTSASTGSANPSVNLSGVTAGNLTIALAGGGSNITAQTQTLSWSKNVDELSQMGCGRMSRSASSGAVTHGFTMVSDHWAAVIVEVAAAGGGGGATPEEFRLATVGAGV